MATETTERTEAAGPAADSGPTQLTLQEHERAWRRPGFRGPEQGAVAVRLANGAEWWLPHLRMESQAKAETPTTGAGAAAGVPSRQVELRRRLNAISASHAGSVAPAAKTCPLPPAVPEARRMDVS